MKIAIFGATGMVGKQLVQQALFKGYEVNAFGRNVFTCFNVEEKNLNLIKGGVFDEKEVLFAIQNCDAVLSALGGSADGIDKTRTLGIKNIIAQMQVANIKRIIAIGGLGILNADENTLLIETEDYPKEFIPVGKEHQIAFNYLVESNLEFTFVCPPNILDKSATGSYVTKANYPPDPNSYKINSGDLAMFMLNELERNEFVREKVGIAGLGV